MPARMTLPPLSAEAHADLLAHYNAAADPESRTRFQMVLLAGERDLTPRQIAPLVQRSHDVVVRVLQRFQLGGLGAVPQRKGPGARPKVDDAWQRELVRVIDDDPHLVGVDSANWTTQLLADYLAQKSGLAVHPETVRRHLHRLGYVCKRPTWTVEHKAAEREGWVGKGCGARSY